MLNWDFNFTNDVSINCMVLATYICLLLNQQQMLNSINQKIKWQEDLFERMRNIRQLILNNLDEFHTNYKIK